MSYNSPLPTICIKVSITVISKSDKASNLKIDDYSKRVFATEEEADEDEWSEYAEEYSFQVNPLNFHSNIFINSNTCFDKLKLSVTNFLG